MSPSYPAFPSDPTDEELARDWTLSAVDFVEVRRCRGEDNRHRFAVQLCALRTLGRFADDVENVPVRVSSRVGGDPICGGPAGATWPAYPTTDAAATPGIAATEGGGVARVAARGPSPAHAVTSPT